MKLLVTGCCGFIGSHLSEKLLEMKYEVVGIDCYTDYYSKELKEKNLSQAMENNKFIFLEKNLLDCNLKDLLKDVDYIFHEAAQAGVRYSWGQNFDTYTKNNILATQKLLDACRYSKVKKIIYASSSSVYGDILLLPMKETAIVRPVSPYGVSKLATEHLCYLYYKNYQVPSVVLRYFTVYGPRGRPDMAPFKFTKKIDSNKIIEVYGDGTSQRDYTYVSDIVAGVLAALDANKEFEIFNLGGNKPIELNKFISLIEDNLGKKAIKKNIEKQQGDVDITFADLTKSRIILNYNPKISIEEGIKNLIMWYRNLKNVFFCKTRH